MKAFSIIIVIIIAVAGAIWFFGSPLTDTPKSVVSTFYDEWIDAAQDGKNPIVDRIYADDSLVTDAFVTRTDSLAATFEQGGYDPVLCAQDIPTSYDVATTSTTGGSAVVRVVEDFSGSEKEIGVSLLNVDGQWKIDAINCQPNASTVKLFYYNPELDMDETGNLLCSAQGLVPVQRQVSATGEELIADTIRLLLSGNLTQSDRDQGVETEFPLSGLELKTAELDGSGILTLTFDDSQNKTVGGSCRVGVLWRQIEATAQQFDDVKEVRFMPEELFQP